MFSNHNSTNPVMEARYVACAHCGHTARTGLRMASRADQLTADSRCDCPRCGKPADIRSRIGSGRIVDVYSRMHVELQPLRRMRSWADRTARKLRAPFIASIGAAIFVALSTTTLGGAVADAMEHKTSARSNYPAARDADGFCDARIRAFRDAPAGDLAWRELEARCPSRISIIRQMSRHDG